MGGRRDWGCWDWGCWDCIEVQYSENCWKLFKMVWLIRRENAYIFNVYYRKINQKDKLLYVDMEKACLSVYL